MASEIALIGLGANLGQPSAQISTALDRLAALPGLRLLACSDFYRSPAWGDTEQPDFVNAAAAFAVQLAPIRLLRELLEVEQALGRVRNQRRWGPRRIDLDLLCFGTRVLQLAALHLPHPGIGERAFVLVPLLDLAERLPQLPAAPWRQQLNQLHHADVVRMQPPNRPQ